MLNDGRFVFGMYNQLENGGTINYQIWVANATKAGTFQVATYEAPDFLDFITPLDDNVILLRFGGKSTYRMVIPKEPMNETITPTPTIAPSSGGADIRMAFCSCLAIVWLLLHFTLG